MCSVCFEQNYLCEDGWVSEIILEFDVSCYTTSVLIGFFGKFNIQQINVILLVFFQINLVYVRLFTETCKQTESSYKRYHTYLVCPSAWSIWVPFFYVPKNYPKRIREKKKSLNYPNTIPDFFSEFGYVQDFFYVPRTIRGKKKHLELLWSP